MCSSLSAWLNRVHCMNCSRKLAMLWPTIDSWLERLLISTNSICNNSTKTGIKNANKLYFSSLLHTFQLPAYQQVWWETSLSSHLPFGTLIPINHSILYWLIVVSHTVTPPVTVWERAEQSQTCMCIASIRSHCNLCNEIIRLTLEGQCL